MAQTGPLAAAVREAGDRFGNDGNILVLLETPSGFAIFSFCGVKLLVPDAMETIWTDFVHHYRAKQVVFLRAFQTFEDKSSAINVETGVNIQLTKMIKNCRLCGQTLAVEKPEYATIIQSSLGISCLCNDVVMELMWGLKNLMRSLVRAEKIDLTKEDRLPMSQGLIMFLNRNGLFVEPELVNEHIVLGAKILYDSECIVKDQSYFLQNAGCHLLDVSGIDYEKWDFLKLSTALQLVCFPDDNVVARDLKIFSNDELLKLKRDAPKYDRRLNKVACLRSYKEIVRAREIKAKKIEELKSLIEEAQQAQQAQQARGLRKYVKLNKRKRLKLKIPNEDNETRKAEQAEKVKAQVEQTEVQQLRRPKKLAKLSEGKFMRLTRLRQLYKRKHLKQNS